MQSHLRSTVLLLRKYSFLLLAFSVFGFGLQARLAQYKPIPPNPTASKIATKRHTEADSQEARSSRNELDLASRAFLIYACACFNLAPTQSITHVAEIGLANPARFDLNGAYHLHRPPPARS